MTVAPQNRAAPPDAVEETVLKMLGSYALARLLGGGLMLAIVIYLLLTLLGR